MEKLQKCYNAALHPRVRTREKLAENVRNEFIQAMSLRCTPQGEVTE